jgi:putative ABC transport system permease protein
MSIWRLAIRELFFRKGNLALSVLAVGVAVACLVGSVGLLRSYDRQTDAILAEKESKVKMEMNKLEEDARKSTKGLGFNITILPKEQGLSDFYADDFAKHYMPENYVEKLSRSKVVTVQHLQATLQQKVEWKEKSRSILLVGARAELPGEGGEKLKPMQPAVAPGTMVVGYELHKSLGIKVGHEVEVLGRKLKVASLKNAKGTKDDITLWVDLATAQAMLDKAGLINGILALECQCAWGDLAKVREEITEILPDTKVIEFQSKALARAEMRQGAARAAAATIENETIGRAEQRNKRELMIAWMAPLAIVGCGVWVGLLALNNARERRGEVAILRAVGVRRSKVLGLFLFRAALVAVIGAAAGCVIGFAAGGALGEPTADRTGAIVAAVDWKMALLVLAAAPVVTIIASWIPATLASQTDPADILREV